MIGVGRCSLASLDSPMPLWQVRKALFASIRPPSGTSERCTEHSGHTQPQGRDQVRGLTIGEAGGGGKPSMIRLGLVHWLKIDRIRVIHTAPEFDSLERAQTHVH